MNDKSYLVDFVCPKCSQSTGIDEVMTSVTRVSRVEAIHVFDKDGGHNIWAGYDESFSQGGKIESFICSACGEKIAEDIDSLLEFLKENDMISPSPVACTDAE